MQVFEFGKPEAGILLIQPVDDHDLSGIESEVSRIRELAGEDFRLLAVKVPRWNRDLSPWPAPPVFGSEGFGDGAGVFLEEILTLAGDRPRTKILGGYSLAGLFALWAGTQTEAFTGVAAASPSVWFPGFTEFLARQPFRARSVALSLGDREEKTRNPVMARVGDCIRETKALLDRQGVNCCLEWNEGNHFRDPDLRTAKAFARVMLQITSADS